MSAAVKHIREALNSASSRIIVVTESDVTAHSLAIFHENFCVGLKESHSKTLNMWAANTMYELMDSASVHSHLFHGVTIARAQHKQAYTE